LPPAEEGTEAASAPELGGEPASRELPSAELESTSVSLLPPFDRFAPALPFGLFRTTEENGAWAFTGLECPDPILWPRMTPPAASERPAAVARSACARTNRLVPDQARRSSWKLATD
jgi:hypothetical protein